MPICRLCSSPDNLMYMFDERRQRPMHLLRFYILQGTGIEIKETDVISKMVCHRCCEIAVKLHKYRANAVANDKLLKEQYGVPYTPPITNQSELLRIASEMCNESEILVDSASSREAFDLLNISIKTKSTAEQCSSSTSSTLSPPEQLTDISLRDHLNSDILLTKPQNASLKTSLDNVENYTSSHHKTTRKISYIHPSIKKILTKNKNLIVPAEALESDLSPMVSLDSAEVSDWYAAQLNVIRGKLTNIVIKKVSGSTNYQIKPPQGNLDGDTHKALDISNSFQNPVRASFKSATHKIQNWRRILDSDSDSDSMDRDEVHQVEPPDSDNNSVESCAKVTHSPSINVSPGLQKPIYTARKRTSKKPHSTPKRPVAAHNSINGSVDQLQPLGPRAYGNNGVESCAKTARSALTSVPHGLQKPTARKSTSGKPHSIQTKLVIHNLDSDSVDRDELQPFAHVTNGVESRVKVAPSALINLLQAPYKPIYTAKKRTSSRKSNSSRKRSVRQSDIAEVIPQKKKRIYCNKDALTPLNKMDLQQECPSDKQAQKAIFTSSLELTPIDPLPELVDCQNVLTTGKTLDVFMCPVCSLPCTSKRQLQDHRRIHLTCKYCKTTIRTIELMKKHLDESCFIRHVKDNAVVKLTRVDSLPSVTKKYPNISKAVSLYCDETPDASCDETPDASNEKDNEDDEVVIVTSNEVEVVCISDDSGDEVECNAIPRHKIVEQPADQTSALSQKLKSDSPETVSTVGFPALQKNVTEKEMIRSLFKKYSVSTNKCNSSAQTFAPVRSSIEYTNTNLIVLKNMFSELSNYRIPVELEAHPKITARFKYGHTKKETSTFECWVHKEPIDVLKVNSYVYNSLLSTNTNVIISHTKTTTPSNATTSDTIKKVNTTPATKTTTPSNGTTSETIKKVNATPATKTTTPSNATTSETIKKVNTTPASNITTPNANANASVVVAVPKPAHSTKTTINTTLVSTALTTNCANPTNTTVSVIDKPTVLNTITTNNNMGSPLFTKSILNTQDNLNSVCSASISLNNTAPAIGISTVPLSTSLVHSNNVLIPVSAQCSSTESSIIATSQSQSHNITNQLQPATCMQIVEVPNTGVNQYQSSENVSFGITTQAQPSDVVQLIGSPTSLPPLHTFQQNAITTEIQNSQYQPSSSVLNLNKYVNNYILVANPQFPLLATTIQETPVSHNNVPQIALQSTDGLHTSFVNAVVQAPILYDQAVQNQQNGNDNKQLTETASPIAAPPTETIGYVRVKPFYELSN